MDISIDSLRSNEILMESLFDMRMDQTPANTRHYTEIALEAISSPSGSSVMMDKLFKETEKLESVDFGRIPDSRGDITKYQYYGQLSNCIQLINDTVKDGQTPNIKTMNKLHNILLDGRADFEFGFKTENMIIMNMYKCMVLNLFELENICIVDLTNHIRKKLSVNLSSFTNGQIRSVTKNANQFIKMYENGQWATMVKAFKRGKAADFKATSESFTEDDVAQEWSLSFTTGEPTSTSTVDRVAGMPNRWTNLKNATNNLKDALNNSWIKNLKVPGLVIAIVIAALAIIRGATYLFIHGAANLKKCLKNNAEVLKANITNNPNASEDSIEKQKKMLDKLENTADTIEYDILKSEREANAELAKSNKTEFSPDELRTVAGDFTF